MSETKVRGEQLRFISSATGEHNLDTYLEAAEIGGRTLADILGDIFDSGDGSFRSDIFEFRENPSTPGELQFRVGDYVDPNAGWEVITSTDFQAFVTAAEAAQTAAETAQTAAEAAQTAAETAETNAGNSATAASTSATNASNSATSAANSLATFNGVFLGAQASDPTLDLEGNALTGGELYFNTGELTAKIYDLATTTWYPVGQSTSPTPDQFIGDGFTTGFTLSTSPASENFTLVYIDGVYQNKDTYSTSGTTLTFSTAPYSGADIEVMTLVATDIGTPSDSTVTAAKLDTSDNPAIRGALDLDLLRGQNAVINGDFDIWQRGTSEAITSGTYVADRWSSDDGNSGGATISRQTHTVGQTDVPANPKYYMEHDQTTGATSGSGPFVWQKIEGVETFAGEVVTLTFYAKIASGSLNMNVVTYQNFGTGGSPSSNVTTVQESAVALTTSWAKYTYTFTMPSISGKTLGSNGDDYTGFYIIFPDLNETFTFHLSHVSLVKGDATDEDDPFPQRPTHQELALCQRYFEAGGCGAAGGWSTTTACQLGYEFKVPKRTASYTISLSNSAPRVGEIGAATRTGSSSSISIIATSNRVNGICFQLNNFTGATTYRPAVLFEDYIEIDAEL